MKVNEIKHQTKLMEWQGNILGCRSSNQSVSRWCEEHHVHPTTYYKWEREIFGGVEKGIGVGNKQSLTPVFAELPSAKAPSHTRPVEGAIAAIHFESAAIDIYPGIDPDCLTTLCRVLKSC